MRSDDLDFDLPPELIAQCPPPQREASRLLHYRRGDQSIAHRQFSDLPGLLRSGDLLVFNDARVLPARFILEKPTGGRIEGLFLSETHTGEWRVLLRNAANAELLHFATEPGIAVRILEKLTDGEFRIDVATDESANSLLTRLGRMPLPPYIKRQKDSDDRDAEDRERYQTVFARAPGAVAAPTAGLHFTAPLLEKVTQAGVEQTFVTLNVGIGTFRPVSAESLDQHVMHSESYTISPDAADAINRAKRDGRRVIAVGTTSARVLESQPAEEEIAARSAETSIFIYPPYRWRHVGGMITNFHLPRSTLIAMVAALVGLEEQRRLYADAIANRYRFFSYGDAMFID